MTPKEQVYFSDHFFVWFLSLVSLNCRDQNLLIEDLRQSHNKFKIKKEDEENQNMIREKESETTETSNWFDSIIRV